MKKLISILVCSTFIFAVAAKNLPGPKAGEKAPYFQVQTLMYNQFTLVNELKKIKAKDGLLILDFFATWCEPCKKEFPAFEKIYKELEAKNVFFYAISIDPKRADLWKFIKQTSKVSFNVLWDPNAFKAAKKYGANETLPQLFIIDGDGIIKVRHVGEIKNLEAVLKSEIEKIKPGTFPKFKDIKAKLGGTAYKKDE